MIKILIVDDESSVRKMVRAMLKNTDYEFHDAADGVEAREVCDCNDINLIVTDIVMPKKHGIDLIMEVKKAYPYIPIIAISGGGGVTGRFDYLEIAGMMVGKEHILHKPFSADELRGMVEEALGHVN